MIALMLACTIVGYITLAILILTSAKKNTTHVIFITILLLMGAWALCLLVFLSELDASTRYLSARIFYTLSTIFPPLFFVFALKYPENTKLSRPMAYGVASMTVAMVLISVFYPGFIMTEEAVARGASSQMGLIAIDKLTYLLFTLHFAGFFIAAMIASFRKYQRSTGVVKSQIGLYAFGMLLSAFPGAYVDLYLPYQGDYSLVWVGPVATIVFIGGVAYSIFKHQMFDVRRAVVRSVAYILAVVALVLIYYVLAYGVSAFFFGQTFISDVGTVWNMAMALLLAVAFQPVKSFFDRLTNAVFYRDDYDSAKYLSEIGTIIAKQVQVEPLLQGTLTILSRTVKPTGATFFLVDKQGKIVKTQAIGNLSIHNDAFFDKFASSTLSSRQSFVTKDAKTGVLRSELTERGIAVIASLRTVNGVGGYLFLGEKLSGVNYEKKDYDFIDIMTDELAVALENARQYEEIKAFNETLQAKVEAATHELRQTNKKLRIMDQTKDEFISLTSHQLRTPLTTIKGYLSMLMEGDAGELTAQQRKLVEEAFNSSQRMVHLISDFLNISRIQTGKFVIELSEVNLADILNEEIDQLRVSANSRQINLAYDKPMNFPTMAMDEGKIRQVMMNFIDNAIYYSPASSTITIILSHTASTVEFKVVDQGIGVPKAEQHKLFSKFSRASNAKKQRPDGTGIGLFMAKKVIVALGGAIIFQSVEGKGSTFGFRLNR